MKTKEWKELRVASDAEVAARLRELQQELFNLRLQQAATQRLERPSRLREVRRDIARLQTLLRERQLKTQRAAASVAGGAST
ncbi:MAG: 50S ribosomal protein L29 [Verrucomicrobiae bacterium]|nr:50S ribosomal protein L29 [Verrucomicrobiae bacterium]